jgi:hypothetical protein
MYLVTMDLVAANGAYELHHLSFQSHPGGSPLTATSVNTFPVATLQRDLSWMYLSDEAKWGSMNWSDVDLAIKGKLTPGKRPRPTEDMLELVAVHYEYCQITGMPAVKRLQALLGIPQSTAAHWIRLAKNSGLLAEDAQNRGDSRMTMEFRAPDDPERVFEQWGLDDPTA